MNQEQFATYIKGKSSYISALRAGTKRVGDDYIARLAAAFVEHFKGKGHLNIDFILGKSQYMLVENVPEDEILESVSRGANPDYDVMQQRKESTPSSSQMPPADVTAIWIENAVKAAVRFAEMEIATLKDRIADKDKYIALLEKRLADYEAAVTFIKDNNAIDNWPFPKGVAEEIEKRNGLRL